MPIIMLGVLLAVVELPQLPLLLLLKLHVHNDRCAGAAAAVRHHVLDDAICCCFIVTDVFSPYLNTICFGAPLGIAVSCTASIYPK